MGILKDFLEENKRHATIIFLAWLCFCLAGTIFGSRLDEKEFLDAGELIKEAFLTTPKVG